MRYYSLMLLTTMVFVTSNYADSNWTHWRGPDFQGNSDDTRVPLQWNEKQNVLWKSALPGNGNSSPIIHNNKAFLTASSDDGSERMVICIDTKSGKKLWEKTSSKSEPAGKTHQWNGFASASCTTDGERVYAFFGTPGLFCYSIDGNLLWKKSFGVFTSEAGWGTAASPFLFEDLVIQNCDNDGDKGPLPAGAAAGAKTAPVSLIAMDKKTGEIKWETKRDLGRGFSTPMMMKVAAGRQDLVLNGPNRVAGYDPKTGKELWRCDRSDAKDQAKFGEPMPVSDGQLIFILSGRPGPCQALRLPGEGDVTKSHVAWQEERKKHRDVSSPVLFNNIIYQPDSKGMLTAINLNTGKEIYDVRLGNGKNKTLGSPIIVRGKLLFLMDDGETVVVDPGLDFKVLYRNVLGNGTALDFGASPTVSDGRLFVRSQKFLYCVGEK